VTLAVKPYGLPVYSLEVLQECLIKENLLSRTVHADMYTLSIHSLCELIALKVVMDRDTFYNGFGYFIGADLSDRIMSAEVALAHEGLNISRLQR
jgi:hypothetical protein